MNADTKGGIGAAAASGAAWSAASMAGRQVMSVAALAVLARFVPPSAYGLMGMATTITNFLLLFRDLGTASALIQRKEIDEPLLASVFWLNAGLGLLMTLATAGLADVAAWFFHEPEVGPVMRLISVTFTASALSMVHGALLSREMRFRRMAVAELGGAAIGYGVSIVMALRGYGVWSLAWGNVAVMTATTLLFWVARPWRPVGGASWVSVRPIASYSLNLLGFSVVNYFLRNLDNVVVGRFLGASALGYYQMAYSVMMYPIQNVTQVLGRVMLPAFSRMQDDDARFRRGYVQVVAVIGLVTFPMMLGLMAVAEPFVVTVVGKQWLPIVPLLWILCPLGMVQSVVSSVGYIYTAKARTDWMFRWALISLAVFVPAFLIGVPWGMYGVAGAYAIAFLLLLYWAFAIPFRFIGLRMGEFAQAFREIAICAALMAVVVWLLEWPIARWPVQVRLGVGVAAGTLVYLALLRWRRPPVLAALAELMRETGRGRVAGWIEWVSGKESDRAEGVRPDPPVSHR